MDASQFNKMTKGQKSRNDDAGRFKSNPTLMGNLRESFKGNPLDSDCFSDNVGLPGDSSKNLPSQDKLRRNIKLIKSSSTNTNTQSKTQAHSNTNLMSGSSTPRHQLSKPKSIKPNSGKPGSVGHNMQTQIGEISISNTNNLSPDMQNFPITNQRVSTAHANSKVNRRNQIFAVNSVSPDEQVTDL